MHNAWYSRLLTGLTAFLLILPAEPLTHEPIFAAPEVNYLTSTSSAFQIQRVSLASDGTEGNDSSAVFGNYVSGNGRYVAFGSLASNLVPGDTNNATDIFVYDLLTKQMERVSVASDGTQGNEVSVNSVGMSKDGRYVVFHSRASNLVPGDTNGQDDVFIRDRQAGITQRVSIGSDGTQGDNFSGFGYVYVSDDGRSVAYESLSSNLVPNDTNLKNDVFVFDRQTNENHRVSVASDGTQGNNGSYVLDMSPDGRYILFSSSATNLIAGDTNNSSDVFMYDMQTGQTIRLSLGTGGIQGNGDSDDGAFSDDGRFIGFTSLASNLVSGDTNNAEDVFVFDRQNKTTTRVSVSSNGSQSPGGYIFGTSISPDGRFVVFATIADGLVPGDTNGLWDVFVRDTALGTTTLVSVRADGSQSNGQNGTSRKPTISDDGKIIAFSSSASNLVPGDTNGKTDVFIYRTLPAWTIMTYLDGDNNLDSNYRGVFNQYERAANNPNVNLLVAWDEAGNSNSAYYKVKYDANLTNLASYTEGIDHWSKGELNMGDPASLSDFIGWARQNYPAQHYALFISDHGNGLKGTVRDQSNNNDWITVKELSDALSTATSGGGNKIDVVFADSCLMGMIETGYQIRNFANIYLASENLIWIPPVGAARPYTDYVNSISESTTPQTLAASIIGEYSAWLNDTYPDKLGYTLSAVDLNQSEALENKVSGLSSVLQPNLSTYSSQIKSARNAVQKFDSDSSESITSSDEYVDLYDLALKLKEIPDLSIQSAAQDVIDGVNSYVIGNISRPGTDKFPSNSLDPARTHGVSIFFPTGQYKRSFYEGLNLDFAADAVWNPQPAYSFSPLSTGSGWGSFLVDYVFNITPSAPDDPNPPDLAVPPSIVPPVVNSVRRADASPTDGQSIRYIVTFSENVTNVKPEDFKLYTTGVTGSTISDVSAVSDAIYTVTVNSGSGSGTIRLDVLDNDSIIDVDNNPLGGSGAENGSFSSGEIYNIQKPIFDDVPHSYWAWNYIERLYSAGITGGCTASPLRYCPSNPVNRAQMAVFLLRAEHGSHYIPPVATGVFTDVPADDWTASWIEQLANEGITGGCTTTPKQYCPTATITRAQMAVFLLRAEHGASYTPPAATGMFADVPQDGWIAPWVEQLANEAITGGCGGSNFCPGKAVTRDQMAIFLVRTFNLP